MNKVLSTVLATSVLGAAIGFSGCSQEAPKTEVAKTATPAPTEKPKASASEHLTLAKESLTKAGNELKEKNYLGAQDHLTSAKKHLTEAAEVAPAPVKAGIDKALASLADIKDIKAPGTDKTLSAISTSVTALVESASKLSGGMDAAKEMAAGAAGAAEKMMGKAADATKSAASGAAESTKAAAEKAAPKH